MKKSILNIKPAVLLITAIAIFSSCKEDKLDLFEGETNIYFSLQNRRESDNHFNFSYTFNDVYYSKQWYITVPMDSISLSYGYLEKGLLPIDTTYVPVSIMGNLADYDRTISYKLASTSTAVENSDFKILEAKIPANKEVGAIVIELYREKYTEETKTIDLTLVPGNDFYTNYKEVLRSATDTLKASTIDFRVTVSDFLTLPLLWNNWAYYLGTFSAKKVFLLKELVNLDIEIFYVASTAEGPTIAQVTAWGGLLKKYLAEQKAAGNTIYEENGEEMSAGLYA
ncbi:hypothetical protein GGR21_001550 [Dysgonomonas hofstadii]|uniref:DUF4843 domain-containing protein n=1 Tax=Dysgonomonas hofstadii TaxID=637886 RepID=A0A840CRV3_9BACT|nr:DUF4843 domain-containing protein [Dysgonomonas hofstadii]MBB4035655.1 hypothetical protein [Dysgonomonas hofstadii]